MPEELFKSLMEFRYWAERILDRVIAQEQSPWLEGEKKGKTAFDQFVTATFQETVAEFSKHFSSHDIRSWTWKRGHLVAMKQQMFRKGFLQHFFDVGPMPVSGERATLKRGNDFVFYDRTDRAKAHNAVPARGASYRMIVDFGTPDRFWSVLPPGESGYRFSGHYKDQVKLWQEGGLKVVSLDPEKLAQEARHRLILIPEKRP